jgi:beta-glucosidase
MMKLHLRIATCLAAWAAGSIYAQTPAERFVDSLMAQMSWQEKIGQLNLPSVGFDVTGPMLSTGVEEKMKQGLVGGVFNTFTPVAVRKLQDFAIEHHPHHIPLLFGYDVIHGHRTILPIPLGQAASWNLHLIELGANMAAREAAADGLNWTFSPMVDIARDPRWGRVSEGAGEDPWLGSRIAEAMVKGYQMPQMQTQYSLGYPQSVMACVKHFALYGAAEAGRDYNTVDMSPYRMENDYFPPYKAAVQAGVGTAMTSFNDVNGMPATCNSFLLKDVLRNEWGFDGMVVTDYTAINELMFHGMGNGAEVAKKALLAGAEMDMVGELYLTHGDSLRKVHPEVGEAIESACRNILLAKYRLGLFEDPYRAWKEADTEVIMSAEHKELAKASAMESMVLLKNENRVLPLNSTQKIAFVGPQVKRRRDMIGNWSGAGDWTQSRSLWDAVADWDNVSYALGCNLVQDAAMMDQLNPHGAQLSLDERSSEALIKEAVKVAKKADVVVLALGEPYGMSGEAASRSSLTLPEHQQALLEAIAATGKPVVLVLMNGRPLCLSEAEGSCSAILEAWFPGTMGGDAIAALLSGEQSPSGHLTMTFPRNEGQIPIYYNHRNTGRPFDAQQKYTSKYLDVPNTPLYAFGHGLSYADYSLSNLVCERVGSELHVSYDLTRSYEGYGGSAPQVTQLYMHDISSNMTRPVLELKGFDKRDLMPGQTQTIHLVVPRSEWGYYNGDRHWVMEPGEFEVSVGFSSNQRPLQTTLVLD